MNNHMFVLGQVKSVLVPRICISHCSNIWHAVVCGPQVELLPDRVKLSALSTLNAKAFAIHRLTWSFFCCLCKDTQVADVGGALNVLPVVLCWPHVHQIKHCELPSSFPLTKPTFNWKAELAGVGWKNYHVRVFLDNSHHLQTSQVCFGFRSFSQGIFQIFHWFTLWTYISSSRTITFVVTFIHLHFFFRPWDLACLSSLLEVGEVDLKSLENTVTNLALSNRVNGPFRGQLQDECLPGKK